MALDAETVKHIAHLSRLKMDDDQVETVKQNLNNILSFISQLGEVNTDQVSPMVGSGIDHMPWRADVVTDGNCVKKIMANAPEIAENMFVVPKVVE